MAKITHNTSKTKGSNKNPKGTMPADKIKRFKLSGNIEQEDRNVLVSRNTKAIAKSIRSLSTYRMFVHGVAETKLPASLRRAVHYFAIPMTRADSDNPKDRKGLEVTSETEAVDNTNTTGQAA